MGNSLKKLNEKNEQGVATFHKRNAIEIPKLKPDISINKK